MAVDAKARAAKAAGRPVIAFGVGEPDFPTPDYIVAAAQEACAQVRMQKYTPAAGLPELREAVARWIGARFGVDVDEATEIVPTLGSKEAIFSFAQIALGEKRRVAVPEPGYPVYERGALFAGGKVVTVPLSESNSWLPDLDAFDAWDEIALFWVCYPNNPTGAVAPLSFYEELAARAREHGFLLCSDEAYSELWFDEPPVSALQVADRTNIVVFNTLSKRSSMTGYRSGFVCGEPELIAALRSFRPNTGTAPQEVVQRASVTAWNDEAHVEEMRARYARKRELLAPLLDLASGSSEATFYLWFRVPAGESSEAFATRLLEHGVVVAPGSYFGPSGEGYARLALVPSLEECARAATILGDVL